MALTKYHVRWRDTKIEEREVIGETPKFVVVSGYGTRTRREAKHTEWDGDYPGLDGADKPAHSRKRQAGDASDGTELRARARV